MKADQRGTTEKEVLALIIVLSVILMTGLLLFFFGHFFSKFW